jgi:hypothetical protein
MGNDLVKPVDPLDYRLELALNDALLVDVLRSSLACVLDRSSLAAACARRSMNDNTFSLYLTYSTAILHLGIDIWSLRAVRVDPAAVEAVRAANALRERERRVLDYGWTPEGQLWVAARLPATHGWNFVFGIPGAIRHDLAGSNSAWPMGMELRTAPCGSNGLVPSCAIVVPTKGISLSLSSTSQRARHCYAWVTMSYLTSSATSFFVSSRKRLLPPMSILIGATL